jgi:hypothetical protein
MDSVRAFVRDGWRHSICHHSGVAQAPTPSDCRPFPSPIKVVSPRFKIGNCASLFTNGLFDRHVKCTTVSHHRAATILMDDRSTDGPVRPMGRPRVRTRRTVSTNCVRLCPCGGILSIDDVCAARQLNEHRRRILFVIVGVGRFRTGFIAFRRRMSCRVGDARANCVGLSTGVGRSSVIGRFDNCLVSFGPRHDNLSLFDLFDGVRPDVRCGDTWRRQ